MYYLESGVTVETPEGEILWSDIVYANSIEIK